MAVRWSRVAPQVALTPAVRSRSWPSSARSSGRSTCRSPRAGASPTTPSIPTDWAAQYVRLFNDGAWTTSLRNLVVLAVGSALAIVFGFILAAMVEREKFGEGFFRTLFLYPLADLADRHRAGLALDDEPLARHRGLPARARLRRAPSFNWLAEPRDRDVRHHPRLDLARARLLHGADARRAEVDQPRDLERGAARRGRASGGSTSRSSSR